VIVLLIGSECVTETAATVTLLCCHNNDATNWGNDTWYNFYFNFLPNCTDCSDVTSIYHRQSPAETQTFI